MPEHPVSAPPSVRSARAARTLLRPLVGSPPTAQTLAFLLDHRWVGGVIVAVEHTHLPHHLLGVVDIMAMAGGRTPPAQSLVVATVRPQGAMCPDDAELWQQASLAAGHHGIRLVEWFVVGSQGFECPRLLVGEPSRWPA
jgi:hypothetical protein